MIEGNPEFYEKDEILEILNISPATLELLIESYIILAVKQNDGRVIYPKLQFIDKGINGNLSAVFRCFKKANSSGWAILNWLLTPNDYINNETPIQYINETNDFQTIRTIASVSCDLELMG